MAQRSHRDEAAASAVLGVLFMAAIAVTLAGVSLRITADLKEGPQAPAHVALMGVPADAQVRVVKADVGLDWATDIVLSGSCSPLLNGGPFPEEPGTPVAAGDVLSCAAGEDLALASSADRGNHVLYRTSFQPVR
jgi:hypothetical protein